MFYSTYLKKKFLVIFLAELKIVQYTGHILNHVEIYKTKETYSRKDSEFASSSVRQSNNTREI